MKLIIFVACWLVGFIIVNTLQNLYMKITGADVVYYNPKTKALWAFIVGFVLLGLIAKIFGL